MVEKIQDLHLPNTVVARIIKDALPEGINVGKEARCAIARAASFFIIYLTSTTASAAHKQKHKSLSSDNVFDALEEIEFESFISPLREALVSFRKMNQEKKASKANDSKANNKPANNSEEEMETTETELNDGTEIEE